MMDSEELKAHMEDFLRFKKRMNFEGKSAEELKKEVEHIQIKMYQDIQKAAEGSKDPVFEEMGKNLMYFCEAVHGILNAGIKTEQDKSVPLLKASPAQIAFKISFGMMVKPVISDTFYLFNELCKKREIEILKERLEERDREKKEGTSNG